MPEALTSQPSNETSTVASANEKKTPGKTGQLRLEKMELENEETRARIVQLKLKWWQKPRGLILAIIPFVPIFLAGVRTVASRLAEYEKNQAALDQQQGILERRTYEIENKRLGVEKQQIELQNERLGVTRRELEGRVADLQNAEQKLLDDVFNVYTEVCEIGGRIITATDYASAASELKKFNTYLILGLDAEIASPLKRIEQSLQEWDKSKTRPGSALHAAVLALSSACREPFQAKLAKRFPTAMSERTRRIYDEARKTAEDLRHATSYQDAGDAIRQFWQLYYGKLILVESGKVVTAMVNAGDAIKLWSEKPPEPAVFSTLSGVLADELQRLASETKPISVFAQIPVHK